MVRKIKLYEICHSRAGDKGDISNLSLIVYDKKNYDMIKREVSVPRVKKFFKGIVSGKVERYELPQLGALNFVLYDALGGGGSRSLRIDTHGKSLSSFFLNFEINLQE